MSSRRSSRVQALEAMLVYGFPRSKIINAIRNIEKLYDGSWELVQDDNHRVLLEYLLDEDGEASADSKRKKVIIKQVTQPAISEPGRQAAVKLGKMNEGTNYLSSCKRKFEAFKKQARDSAPAYKRHEAVDDPGAEIPSKNKEDQASSSKPDVLRELMLAYSDSDA